MIEINLLPEEMRKEHWFQFNLDLVMGKARVVTSAAFIGFLIAIIILFSIGLPVRKMQTANLIKKEQRMLPQYTEIEAANKEIAMLNAKISALEAVTRRRYLWSEKLNQLSDLLLPGIWLARIYTDSGQSFVIEGSVISRREEAMAAVGKFMKDIRGNAAFFKDFRDIKLESVQRKNLDDRDIVDFKIVLIWT